MRLHPQDSTFARMVLVAGFVTGIVIGTLLLHERTANEGVENGPTMSLPAAGDPELIRCRDLGVAAAEDESCLAAWSEEQQRFLGTERSPEPREQSQTDYVGSVSSALPPVEETAEEAVDNQEPGHGELAP